MSFSDKELAAMNASSELGIEGIEFLEYASPKPEDLVALFHRMGFKKTGTHKNKKISLFEQNDIRFLLNEEPKSFAANFQTAHGPSICSMGWRVKNAKKAFELAISNGAREYKGADTGPGASATHAVYGIGDSLIYLIDDATDKSFYKKAYNTFSDTTPVTPKKLLKIDHLTNNVPKGEMQKWCDFYGKVFGFKEVRYFDIKGLKTGLISKVMVSPGYKVMIPINEPSDGKSQIQEYLDVYHGPGIQHIAFEVSSAIDAVKELNKDNIAFLDAPPGAYYSMLKNRLPLLKEPVEELKKLSLLADGDEAGYIVQIFTKNMLGPIFYELIQRENHWGFGDGNFQALFDSIEREQEQRGYLK